jgi:hypothetical protein
MKTKMLKKMPRTMDPAEQAEFEACDRIIKNG